LGYIVRAFPLIYQLAGVGDLLRGQQPLAAHPYPASHSRRPTRLCPFLDQRPFKFRENANHLPHGAPGGRFRVDSFRQRPEGHPLRFQIIQQGKEVTQRFDGQVAGNAGAPSPPYTGCTPLW
jgi:hypothetical protein